MKHELFGNTAYKAVDGCWVGRCRVPEFSAFGQTRRKRRIFELFIDAEKNELPSAAQRGAFQYFVEHQTALCHTVIDAVFRWYQWHRGRNRPHFERTSCPELHVSEGLRDLMEFEGLRVRGDQFRRIALTGLTFNCKWDVEHGCGVLLHRGTVLDISQAEIAYSEPQWAGSIWLKVCSPREKAAATAVLKSLGVKGRSPRIPPREALVTAILGGDRERVRRLVHQGAEINDVPEGDPHPLFTAIQQSNVDAVKTMLELGADLQAEHYGTTLVGKAAHTIDLIGYRPGGVLGDRFADRHSRATEILQILREAGAR